MGMSETQIRFLLSAQHRSVPKAPTQAAQNVANAVNAVNTAKTNQTGGQLGQPTADPTETLLQNVDPSLLSPENLARHLELTHDESTEGGISPEKIGQAEVKLENKKVEKMNEFDANKAKTDKTHKK